MAWWCPWDRRRAVTNSHDTAANQPHAAQACRPEVPLSRGPHLPDAIRAVDAREAEWSAARGTAAGLLAGGAELLEAAEQVDMPGDWARRTWPRRRYPQ